MWQKLLGGIGDLGAEIVFVDAGHFLPQIILHLRHPEHVRIQAKSQVQLLMVGQMGGSIRILQNDIVIKSALPITHNEVRFENEWIDVQVICPDGHFDKVIMLPNKCECPSSGSRKAPIGITLVVSTCVGYPQIFLIPQLHRLHLSRALVDANGDVFVGDPHFGSEILIGDCCRKDWR